MSHTDSLNQEVLLDTMDLHFLADEMDELEGSYKTTLSSSLSVIGQTPADTDWSTLLQSVEHSQDVTNPSTADNIAAGKQAWVGGVLITGTGKDVTDSYNKGKSDALGGSYTGVTFIQSSEGSVTKTWTAPRDITGVVIVSIGKSCGASGTPVVSGTIITGAGSVREYGVWYMPSLPKNASITATGEAACVVYK